MSNFDEKTVDLLRRAQAGDADGMRELLERYRPRLLERIRLMMGRKARRTAESGDFLQEVVVRIIKNIERFQVRDDQAFLRWAVRVARNAITDVERRSRERAIESLSIELYLRATGRSPSSLSARREEVERLVEILESLPEDYRRVLELRDFERLSFRAIGERMGRSENAAQLLHAQALTKLGGLYRRRG